MDNTKVCTCCKEEKDLSEFPKGRYRIRTNDYYIKTQCRECAGKKSAIRMKERRKARTEEEKKHFGDYQNNWNSENRDKVAAFQKRYFNTEKGKEKNREAQRRFRARQKEKMKMKEQTPKFNVEDVFKPSIDVDELVVAEYKDGVKLDTILENYSISTTELYRILNRKGIPLRNRMSKTKANDRLLTMSSIEKKNFARDYMRGLKLVTLYKKYTLNRHVLYKLVDELGLPRNNRSITEEQQKVLDFIASMDAAKEIKTSCKVEGNTIYVSLVSPPNFQVDKINVTIEVPKEEK